MGYGDNRYGGDNRWRDRGEGRWNERERGYSRSRFQDDDDRGFFDRAGDEVRSWFGDDEAQRRREMDERRWEQEHRMSGGRDSDPRSGGQSMRSPHDQHYSSWRQRQIEDLDRDYDEYCREHQSRFENEFSGFRQTRQTKRQMLTQIREHAEVVDESGQHIGTVDKVRGEKVILTKNDPEAHGVHRSFTCSLLDRVEDGKVYLTGTKDSIRSRLTEEREDDQNRSQGGGMLGGLFGGSGSDRDDRQTQSSTNQPSGQTMSPTSTTGASTTGTTSDGPHMLDKSFSGTYDDDSSTSGRSTKK